MVKLHTMHQIKGCWMIMPNNMRVKKVLSQFVNFTVNISLKLMAFDFILKCSPFYMILFHIHV